jgi:type I restriction-modification system DNA methylase subunit
VDQQGSPVRCPAQGPDRALLASCRSATGTSRSDLLGDAYEYLIKKFADATNKKAGEFYTPRSVVRLMIDMLDPREGETIYDPPAAPAACCSPPCST